MVLITERASRPSAGDKKTNQWRIVIIKGNLAFQRKEDRGDWVTYMCVTPDTPVSC